MFQEQAHAESSLLPGFLLQFVLVQLMAEGAPDGQDFALAGPRAEEVALAAGAGRNGKAMSFLSRQRGQRLFPAVVAPGHLVTNTRGQVSITPGFRLHENCITCGDTWLSPHIHYVPHCPINCPSYVGGFVYMGISNPDTRDCLAVMRMGRP